MCIHTHTHTYIHTHIGGSCCSVTQSCLTLCDPWTEACLAFLFLTISWSFWYWWWLIAKSCLTLATPWTVVHQAPLSMRLSWQEYQSGLPFPSPGDLPNPRIEPGSPHCRLILYWYTHTHTHTHTYIYLNQFTIKPKLAQHSKLTLLQ